MKKTQGIKRLAVISTKPKDLPKPYGFCCDVNRQDLETEYNPRNPPFDSSFPETSLESDRPDVQFRIQDIVKPVPRGPRGGVFRNDMEVKKAAVYGRSKKNRGPLKWFLEEEIEVARDLLAKEKRIRHTEEIVRKATLQKKKKKLRTQVI